jgi:glycerol uptake facilitator-like aquaporin
MWGCVSNLSGEQKLDGTFHRPPFELGSTTVDESLSTGNAFLIEFMGSFFFFFVIAQAALDKRGIADSFFPAFP